MKRTAQWHCRSFRWRAKSTVIGFLSSYNSHMTHLHLKLRELAAKRCGILWCGSNTNHSCCTRLHLSSVLSPTVSDCKHWLLVVSCLTSLSVEWRVGKADSFSLRQVKEHRYGNVRITLLSHHINPHGVVFLYKTTPSLHHALQLLPFSSAYGWEEPTCSLPPAAASLLLLRLLWCVAGDGELLRFGLLALNGIKGGDRRV